MKILIATGTLSKNLRAPDKLVAEIAPLLADNGNCCTVAGICFDAPGKVIQQGNVKYIRMHSSALTDEGLYQFEQFHKKLGGIDRNSSRKAFYLKHPFFSRCIFAKYFFKNSYKLTVKSYISQLEKIISQEKPDCMIITYMPAEFALEAFRIKTDCPKYAYQMDPWGLYEGGDSGFSDEERIQQETEMFSLAEYIFTSHQLYAQYCSHQDYKKFSDKIVPVEFPNITTPPLKTSVSSVIDFDSNYINILFSGVIDDAYRSPSALFSTIESELLKTDFPVRFYFLGTCTSKRVQKYASLYPDKIFLHDRVTPIQANATLQAADFLLNIGNTMTNQVPSKIFDYFSSGKPIINVQKIDNCPARVYFDKYPLCFTFEENHTDTELFKNFILTSKNSIVPFDAVKDLYISSTPEFVVKQISETLLNKKEL